MLSHYAATSNPIEGCHPTKQSAYTKSVIQIWTGATRRKNGDASAVVHNMYVYIWTSDGWMRIKNSYHWQTGTRIYAHN